MFDLATTDFVYSILFWFFRKWNLWARRVTTSRSLPWHRPWGCRWGWSTWTEGRGTNVTTITSQRILVQWSPSCIGLDITTSCTHDKLMKTWWNICQWHFCHCKKNVHFHYILFIRETVLALDVRILQLNEYEHFHILN